MTTRKGSVRVLLGVGVAATPLVLLLLLGLTMVQETKAFIPERLFTNYTDVPKPQNISCYDCADGLVRNADSRLGRCTDFRDLWRKFTRAKKANVGKSHYRNELLYILRKKFGKNCTYGVEDCYYARPEDQRIIGWEERGCGSGPQTIDAEPGEGCATENLWANPETIPFINCVCEEKEDNTRGYCNKATRTTAIGATFGIVTATAILLLLQPLVTQNI